MRSLRELVWWRLIERQRCNEAFLSWNTRPRSKVTRPDQFLGEIDAVTPWPALLAEVEPRWNAEGLAFKNSADVQF